jgi:mono/diheme cytochrome c family protein
MRLKMPTVRHIMAVAFVVGMPAVSPVVLADSGLYVAQAADCASCHTSPDGKPFAGGTPLKSPFGTLYGSNVTPDASSGIGEWTEADFDRALRQGVRKDGSYLYPAMPYTNYTKMSAEDMHALWLYMRALAPVHNVVPKNTLPFPLNVRASLLVWQSLYFKPGGFDPDPKQTEQWNRGAYLVQALGHCDQCHTPRDAAQGLRTNRELTGAEIEGWYAPDISGGPSSKLREWTEKDLARFFKTGTMPANTKAVGPMQEVVHESLSHLTDADLRAMAVYLKHQKSTSGPLAPSPVKWSGQADAQGLYAEQCGACHQKNGEGIPGTVPALAHNDAVTAAEPSNVVMAMLEGFPAQGSWGAMGSFAQSLTDEQIADVANYVRTAWGNGAAPNATPWAVASWRKYAEAPKNSSRALLCPDLSARVMKPALAAGPNVLQQAASDRGKMSQLVHNYEAAVPNASSGEVIEALSTAYCRALADTAISEARMSAQIASFAQRVAITVGSHKSM